MNLEKNTVTLDFTANVTLKAHYDMNGQVLILPIKGNGPAKIKISEYAHPIVSFLIKLVGRLIKLLIIIKLYQLGSI